LIDDMNPLSSKKEKNYWGNLIKLWADSYDM